MINSIDINKNIKIFILILKKIGSIKIITPLVFFVSISMDSEKWGVLEVSCQSDKIISRIDNGKENKL